MALLSTLRRTASKCLFGIYFHYMEREQTKTDTHKRWSAVIAFALPLALMLGVYLSTVLPWSEPETEYDFVYALCDWDNEYYYYRECGGFLNDVVQVDADGRYYRGEVNPNRDTDNDDVPDIDEGYEVRFFYHDSAQNETREIVESELASYTLSPLLSSPDGASVEYNYHRSPEVLFVDVGSSGYEYELVQGGKSKKLNLIGVSDRRYYRDQFEFVGWVISERN